MQRTYRNNTDTAHDRVPNQAQLNKSPIRRQNVNPSYIARSPIRSRTPTRHVSPLKNATNTPNPIKFISNVSPAKEKRTNYENQGQLSNGKGIKYINNNYNDKIY